MSIFKKKIVKKYPTGAIKNPLDLRRVKLTQVQTPVKIPKKYITDISMFPVLNQRNIGACVGHAHALVHAYHEFKETCNIKGFSPRYLYALSKKVDGVSGEGTYPEVTAKIQKDKGCSLDTLVPNNTNLSHEDYISISETEDIKNEAYQYRNKGYAEVANDKEALKQAIYQNGLVAITISVGGYNTRLKKGSLGLHRVVAYGYNGNKFYFRNSWDYSWGNKGNGWFYWKDQELSDIMVFTDIPNEIIEGNKDLPTLRINRYPSDTKQTLGEFIASYNKVAFAGKTLELVWKNNSRYVSCIPTGKYVCKWEWSKKYNSYIFRVYDVKGRSGILGHPGNYFYDIEGCILCGENHLDINRDGELDVTNTRVTLSKLYSFFGGHDFTLIIK